jgi:hypothetical protein
MTWVAALVAASKERHPSRYCSHPGCLWRVQSRTGATPCPRHPATPSTTPFPGYDVRTMTYHGGSVGAEQHADDRQHIANDAAEAIELRERWEEME